MKNELRKQVADYLKSKRKPAVIFIIALLSAACNGTPKVVTTISSSDTITIGNEQISHPDTLGQIVKEYRSTPLKNSDTIDLGIMYSGEVIKREVLLHNGTNKPLVILSVSTSCGCTSTDFEKAPIAAGADSPFSFEFNSRGFYGFQLKHITINTSAGSTPHIIVITAEVKEGK